MAAQVAPQTSKARPLHATILISEYGDLLNLNPYARARTHKTGKVDLREVRLINDNTTAKDLLKLLNQHPSTHFLFDPSKCHYGNARAIYQALKKLVEHKHYGHLDKKQVQKLDEKYGVEEEGEEADGEGKVGETQEAEAQEEGGSKLGEERKLKRK